MPDLPSFAEVTLRNKVKAPTRVSTRKRFNRYNRHVRYTHPLLTTGKGSILGNARARWTRGTSLGTEPALPGRTMSLQFSVAVRNARLDAIETAIGASAILKIRSGAPPANCGAADAGTVLATLNLPADYMAAAASGSKGKSGTWEDTTADATGTAAHFRLYASDGTTCHLQGTVTLTGGGGDLTLDSVTLTAGQPVTITGFTITDGNA